MRGRLDADTHQMPVRLGRAVSPYGGSDLGGRAQPPGAERDGDSGQGQDPTPRCGQEPAGGIQIAAPYTLPLIEARSTIGTWAAIGGIGFGTGPVVGGILLTFFGWQSLFWVNLPIAAAAVVGTLIAVRESRNSNSSRLDGLGLVLISTGLVAVTFALVQSSQHSWDTPSIYGPFVLGLVLLAGFAGWECRFSSPMVPPALLRARSFVSASVVYLVSYAAFTGGCST
jgi:hypothetical protein